ncbi:MAG: selenium-dependent xanthine dehydrogenase [Thermoanaerobaculaceae bacterium]|nr:selenium-dependent xanthine dehydrogenase [Thermoanaerobaculaceae bacterium]
MPTVTFTLNGALTTARYEEGMHVLEVLREECGVTSPKDGCAPQGVCGCCTVLVDGRPALACLKKPPEIAGRSVVTLEGIPEAERAVLARAFVQEGAVQCGYCTPGIMVRAASLVERGKAGDRDAVAKALAGHTCRCTGYQRIFDAIRTAGEAWDAGGVFASERPRRRLLFGEAHGMARRSPADGGRGVGGSEPRYRGLEHAVGAKPYVADMRAPGMRHGAVVLALHPRARVLAIDAGPALAMAGVERVLTAADVPGDRFVGLIVKDWPVFVAVGETTRCVGDVLALVVADTQFHARQAAKAVRVEVDALSPVTSPEAALAPGAPAIHPGGNLLEVTAFARGDVEAALAASAHVVRRTFTTQRIEHAFLEPEACLVVPEDDGVRVYSQGQGVHDDQVQIAAVLGVARGRVMVELVSNGGAFGGKEDLSVQAQTALAALLLGAPVRTVLTREQSILLHPKRHPLTMDYAVGCDGDGQLTAVRARIVGDTGAYASVGAKVLERAAGHSCGPYRVPVVDVEAKTVYTNNPPSGAMRGFGVCQTAFAIEGCLDLLAERVGLDGYDIRERNILAPGDRFATGQIMTEACGIRATLAAVRDVYKANAGRAGIACGIKNTGIGNGLADIGRVLIRVLPAGRLDVLTGFTEMGQGLFTILRQVVHEETGIAPEAMAVGARSELAVECGMTTASRATALATMAGQRAARKLAADLAGAPLAALAGREYQGEYVCDITVAPGTKVDNPVTHMTFGYATQVVLMDGDGRIEKVVAAHDVGRAINPLACAQQIEGAVHMGLGYALSEELPCREGRPVSTLMRDLGILKAGDTPEVEVILIEVPDPVGGYGAKGVGEIGLVPTAAAVAGAMAVFDGVHRTALPMADAPAAPGRRRPGGAAAGSEGRRSAK